jgi:hypothetical protein
MSASLSPAQLHLVLASIIVLTSCTQSNVQSQQHFDQAIDNFSTLNPIVKIEFVDLRANTSEHQCVFASMLREAVRLELRLQKDQEGFDRLIQFIKRQPKHRFGFRDAEAIETLQAMRSKFDMRKACEIIDLGRPAMIGDYAPYLYAGSEDGKGWTKVD